MPGESAAVIRPVRAPVFPQLFIDPGISSADGHVGWFGGLFTPGNWRFRDHSLPVWFFLSLL